MVRMRRATAFNAGVQSDRGSRQEEDPAYGVETRSVALMPRI